MDYVMLAWSRRSQLGCVGDNGAREYGEKEESHEIIRAKTERYRPA